MSSTATPALSQPDRLAASGAVTLTLPYPVSANRYWRPLPVKGRNIFVRTKEANQFVKGTAAAAALAGVKAPLLGRIALEVQLFPARPQDWARRARKAPESWDDDVRCIDLDNANKVLLDALKGVVFEDDRWVRSLSSQRMEPDELGARLVVHVRQLACSKAQASLIEEAA